MKLIFALLFCAAAFNVDAVTTVVRRATDPVIYDAATRVDNVAFTVTETTAMTADQVVAFWVIPGTTIAKLTTFAGGAGIVCGISGTNFSTAGNPCLSFTCDAAACTLVTATTVGSCAVSGAVTTCTATRPFIHTSGNILAGTPYSIVFTTAPVSFTGANLLLFPTLPTGILSNVVFDVLALNPDAAVFAPVISASSVDTINTAFMIPANGIFGLGWGASATALFPSWAIVCSNVSKTCITMACTSAIACTASDAATTNTVMWEPAASFLKSIAVATTATTGALTFTYGPQANLLWTSGVTTSALTAATAITGFWNRFATPPTVAAYTATGVPFTATLSASAPNVAQITMTSSAASRLNALGWRASQSLNPAYILACNVQETTAANQCAMFNCPLTANKPVGQPGAVTCAQITPVYAGSSVRSQSGLTMVYERLIQPAETGAHVITPGTQNLLFFEAAAVGAAIGTISNVSSPTTTYVSNTAALTAFQGTAPTFGVTATAASATTTTISITTNSGKYALTGLGNAAQAFPSVATVCEPVALTACGIYTCTAASTCTASTATVAQTRDAAARMATMTFTNTDLPARTESSFDAQRLPGRNNYLFWAEENIPSGGLTLAPALVQGKTWNPFALAVGPVGTAPTFPIAFSRASATALNVTLTPGTGKTAYFGWRADTGAQFPTDAVICTANSQPCIDVSCSAAATCITRATTIYTTNKTTATVAELTRPLSGGVVIPATGTMFLAWDLVDTPATITAATAQSRTWKFYTAPVPTTSNTIAIIPSFLLAVLLISNLL